MRDGKKNRRMDYVTSHFEFDPQVSVVLPSSFVMEHFRTAKSGGEWTFSDLVAYNINVQDLDAQTFFGVAHLPPVPIQGDFVSVEKWRDMGNQTDRSLGFQMALAMGPGDAEPSIDLFAIKLLERIGYTNLFRQLVLRKDQPLHICGETKHAKTDVALVAYDPDFAEGLTILLVQEDKRANEPDPVAQLIAEAIAAADMNNWVRKTRGLEPLALQVRYRKVSICSRD